MYPVYSFKYPRPAYSLDLMPFYDITAGDPDEAIVNNGTVTAALAPNESHNGYLPCALRRITTPPFTMGDNIEPTFFLWGRDDDGFHMIKNTEYTMDFSLKGLLIHTDRISFDGVENGNWAVDIEYNALPEKRVIVAIVTYRNIGSAPRSLSIAAWLRNPQITYSLEWTQYTPPTGRVDASFNPKTGFGAIETVSSDRKAASIIGFNKKADSYSVTLSDEAELWKSNGAFGMSKKVSGAKSHNQYISHSLGEVAPGECVSISVVLAIAGTIGEARELFIDTVMNLPERLREAEEYWNRRWEETGFEIVSPDEDINRMSELAMCNGILGHDPVNKAWITSCGRAFRGVTFLWDQYYANYGLLIGGGREAVKKVISDSAGMDLSTNNFYGIVDKRRLGYHYASQHFCITYLVYKYITLFGDIGFLNEKLENGLSVIEFLSAQAEYVAYGIEFDFGATWEILECVSRHIKELPELTANTCWMAEKIKAMALVAGRDDIADKMGPIRDKAYQKLQSLWDPRAKWFRSHQGNLVYSCQIFLSILSEVLTEEQIAGLMSRIDDFVDPLGVKSLAVYDPEFQENSRGDFNGAASYVGTPGEFANILSYLGDRKRLFKLVKGISKWWRWRPFQPQGIDSTTGIAAGLISNEGTNNCASVYMSMVPMNLMGLRPAIGGIDVYECFPEEWSNWPEGPSFNGKSYTVKVTLPYKDYRYTYYVDKPAEGAGEGDGEGSGSGLTYSYASIYRPDGKFVKEWHAQRLPDMGEDSVIILHFRNSKPIVEGVDLITKVCDISDKSAVLENRKGDVRFSLNRDKGGKFKVILKGMPLGSYTVYVNGTRVGGGAADSEGMFTYRHTQVNEKDDIHISLVPAGLKDLALKCKTVADSRAGKEFGEGNAVDGNHRTLWAPEVNQLPHWIRVDLGSVQKVHRVDIDWYEMSDEEYKVQVSKDCFTWRAVAIRSDKHVKGLMTHTFEETEARYVRVFITNRSYKPVGIFSINVY